MNKIILIEATFYLDININFKLVFNIVLTSLFLNFKIVWYQKTLLV